LKKYYLERNEDYFNRRSGIDTVVSIFNWASGACLIAAVFTTVVFAWQNINQVIVKEVRGMKDNTTEDTVPMTPYGPTETKARTPVAMTPVAMTPMPVVPAPSLPSSAEATTPPANPVRVTPSEPPPTKP
jgi:hypothetical protein